MSRPPQEKSDDGEKSDDTASGVPLRAWVLLVALTIAWGSMWPFLKVAVAEIPLLTLRAGSALGGGLMLVAVAAAAGLRLLPPSEDMPRIALCGAFQVFGWFILSTLAVSMMPAGRASLLAYTMPFWALLIGVLALGERITPRRALGVAAGVGAIFLMAWDDLRHLGAGPVPWGVIVIISAAICWSVGSTLQKNLSFRSPVTTVVSWQLLLASAPLGVLALLLEPTDWIETVSMNAIGAAAAVTFVSIGIGLWCWVKILTLTSMAFASIAVLSVPLTSLALSAVLLGEPFGAVEAIGASLVVFGLITVLPFKGLPAFRR